MNIVWLIISLLAIIFGLPCIILAGICSKIVASELCIHCVYEDWEGKTSPCYNCVDCDRFERKVEDG